MAKVTIIGWPIITAQPQQNTTYAQGATAVPLSVTASITGAGTLSYQWFVTTAFSATGGIAIPDATEATFTPPTAETGVRRYYVEITNTHSTADGTQTATRIRTSNIAQITVNALVHAATPNITTHPQSASHVQGATATMLNVSAWANFQSLTYQWFSNTVDDNTTGTAIPDATGASFRPPTAELGTLYYYVVVTNTDTRPQITGNQTATATSDVAMITITAPGIVNAQIPNITAHPQGATYAVGQTPTALSITANVTDGGQLSYQWYSNTVYNSATGTAIGGATNASFTPLTTATGTLYYYVIVTNTNSAVNGSQTTSRTSSIATVTVNPIVNAQPPIITVQPQDAIYTQGATATPLTVTAHSTDGGTLSYQWYIVDEQWNSIEIPGANSSSYTPLTTTVGTVRYFVGVINTNTSVNGSQTANAGSSIATITVNAGGGNNFANLRINEVSGVEGAGGSCDIFYELMNIGDTSIDLTGVEIWYNANGSIGQPFPPTDDRLTWKGGATNQPSGVVQPGELFLIQGRNNCSNGPIQTGLTSSRILIITLKDPSGNVIDQMARAEDNIAPYNSFGSNVASYSRIPDGTGPFYFTTTPTPGTTNGTNTAGLVLVPQTPVGNIVNAQTPNITAQPQSATVNVNDPVNLSVTAGVTDGGIMSYQWFRNTIDSAGGGTPVGTNSTSFAPPTNTAGTLYYYVVVTNTNTSVNGTQTASATSSIAMVVVNTAGPANAEKPTITTQPRDTTVSVGTPVTLTIIASVNDGGALSYQWYTVDAQWNNILITGANSNTYTPPTSAVGAEQYMVMVTNTNTNATNNQTNSEGSNWAMVTVNAGTNIVELETNNGVQVFPNPVIDELRIVIPPDLPTNTVVELFDMSGRRVFSAPVGAYAIRPTSTIAANAGGGVCNTPLRGDTITIDMTPFYPGNYILRIGNHTAKIVKQ